MVTPLVLTYNEELNIERTLTSLTWASRVVVLDSGSSDRTREIAMSFKNVCWFHRSFDSHCNQWRYGVDGTGIDTDYVLALDADMSTPDTFRTEIFQFLLKGFNGARVPFQYRVLGRPLHSSIYPPQLRLFRRDLVTIRQPGHTQIFEVDGPTYTFRSQLIHEDRKPLDRWLANQTTYAVLEAARIRRNNSCSLKDLVRRLGCSPVLLGAYSYFKAGGLANGKSAVAYACERLIFEALLTRMLQSE